MKKNLRLGIQLAALVIFTVLLLLDMIEIWMMLILVSAVLPTVLGRIYCGWLCPIHTVMRFVSWLRTRLGREASQVPERARNSILRYAVFAVTIVLLILTGLGLFKIPLIPLLIIPAAAITFFYHSAFWHRLLCPFGTLFSIFAKKPFWGLWIDKNSCVKCGKCADACPSESIIEESAINSHSVISNNCLTCFLCQEACNKEAIEFSFNKRKKLKEKYVLNN